MARTREPFRLVRIVDAALVLFMRDGYRRTGIADVARAAGVSQGTVLLYAKTKVALFELAFRRALNDSLDSIQLPYQGPPEHDLVAVLWARFGASGDPTTLTALANEARRDGSLSTTSVAAAAVVYDWLARNWRVIRLIEICAREWPDLARHFYSEYRRSVLHQLESCIRRDRDAGRLSVVTDPALAARFVLETCAFFAMHRHMAPDSSMDDSSTRVGILRLIESALRPSDELRLPP